MKVKKNIIIRLLEILPGFLTWLTLISAPILAYYHPVWVALYIIVFDLFWFLKGANVAIHLMHSYKNLKIHSQVDWLDWSKRLNDISQFKIYLKNLRDTEKNKELKNLYKGELARLENFPDTSKHNWESIYHLIVMPTFKEDISILEASIESYIASDYPKDKILFVLAVEERGGQEALHIGQVLKEKYASKFGLFMVTVHPDGLEGEVRGKAGNMNYASLAAKLELDKHSIRYEDVIISAFDADTIASKNYFSYLTFAFLTESKPMQASYQPMPVYHNNIWDTPAIARVIAISSSFWQLVEASRPDRLITFSSHAMSFKTLLDVGLFRKDSINEDSFIFWQCFVHFKGDYKSHPLFTTVSMDAVQGESYIGTLIAQYKQKRRWAYGASQISFVVTSLYKNKDIPLWKRFIYSERIIEGHYFWSTASIMIAILGWLPLILGGDRFNASVLGYNLPVMTRAIMSVATLFLIASAYINLILLPPRPKKHGKWKSISMVLQWLLTPIVSSIFGSLPAIDAQTRLMFGKYMEFWVTPKIRKNLVEETKIGALSTSANKGKA